MQGEVHVLETVLGLDYLTSHYHGDDFLFSFSFFLFFFFFGGNRLYLFARAATAKYHRPGGFNNSHLFRKPRGL